MRQTAFSFIKDYRKEFGGSKLLGKRKSKRPLSTKKPIHLVLKSDHKNLFNPGNRSLEKLIRSQCKKFDIKIFDMALNWSHVHLLVCIHNRAEYVKFIKSLTSILAIKIRKFKSELKQIFSLRPFTRIVEWGRDFRRSLDYQELNQLEALGFIKREIKKKQEVSRKNQRKWKET